eukprot:CFRG5124T1
MEYKRNDKRGLSTPNEESYSPDIERDSTSIGTEHAQQERHAKGFAETSAVKHIKRRKTHLREIERDSHSSGELPVNCGRKDREYSTSRRSFQVRGGDMSDLDDRDDRPSSRVSASVPQSVQFSDDESTSVMGAARSDSHTHTTSKEDYEKDLHSALLDTIMTFTQLIHHDLVTIRNCRRTKRQLDRYSSLL